MRRGCGKECWAGRFERAVREKGGAGDAGGSWAAGHAWSVGLLGWADARVREREAGLDVGRVGLGLLGFGFPSGLVWVSLDWALVFLVLSPFLFYFPISSSNSNSNQMNSNLNLNSPKHSNK